MFCPCPLCLSSARFALGKQPQARDRCHSGTRRRSDDRTISLRSSTNDRDGFRTDPRDFLRTIGVSRGERSARRCTVRAPSLQLWAIPRRGEPHNELTILPSISKLALYWPCRENTLYLVSPFLHPLLYAFSTRASEGRGGEEGAPGIEGPRNNVRRWKKATSENSYHEDCTPAANGLDWKRRRWRWT